MNSGISSQFKTGMLSVVAVIVCCLAQPVRAEVALCQSNSDGSVHAREGGCQSAETAITTAVQQESMANDNPSTVRATNMNHVNADVECDPNEDRYWVKEAPFN